MNVDAIRDDHTEYRDETVPLEDELTRIDRELKDLQPHSLDQYCDYSRRFSTRYTYKPTFIGYSVLPESPLGVSH